MACEPRSRDPGRFAVTRLWLEMFWRVTNSDETVESSMETARFPFGYRVPTPVLSIALLVCSGLWLVAACEYNATSGLKADWSATPLFWMLAVVLAPAICVGIGMILIDQRKRRRFGLIDWWALLAAFLPVTFGTFLSVWAVKALFLMSGV